MDINLLSNSYNKKILSIKDGCILSSGGDVVGGLGWEPGALSISGTLVGSQGYILVNGTYPPESLFSLPNAYSGIFIQISGGDEDYIADNFSLQILGSKPSYGVTYSYNGDKLSDIDVAVVNSTNSIDSIIIDSGFIGFANENSGENSLNKFFTLNGLNGLSIPPSGTGIFNIESAPNVPRSLFLENASLPIKLYTNYGRDQLLLGISNSATGGYVSLPSSDAQLYYNKIGMTYAQIGSDSSGIFCSASFRVLKDQPPTNLSKSRFFAENVTASGSYEAFGSNSFTGMMEGFYQYLYTIPYATNDIYSAASGRSPNQVSGILTETKVIRSAQTKYYRDFRLDEFLRISRNGESAYSGSHVVRFSGYDGSMYSGVLSVYPNIFRGFDCNFITL